MYYKYYKNGDYMNKSNLRKPRAIRFTEEQEKVFIELESKGINVSKIIRDGADKVIVEILNNSKFQFNNK